MTNAVVPHNQEAEESLLGSMLLSTDAAEAALDVVDAEDFYVPAFGNIFVAIKALFEAGRPIDAVTVTEELRNTGFLDTIGTPAIMVSLQANTPSIANAVHYATIVAEHGAARRLLYACQDTIEKLRTGEFERADNVTGRLQLAMADMEDFGVGSGVQSITFRQLVEMAETDAPWIIPGLLRKDWKTIVTGLQGVGKAILLRTCCMASAQGFHPFSHRPMTPIRTLLVDIENPKGAIAEAAVKLEHTLMQEAGEFYDDNRFKIFHRLQGLNLRNRRDRSDLRREIAAHKPDLVAIGPLYKMASPAGDNGWEAAALETITILDTMRTKYGFALLIEAHPKKGDTLEPKGSNLWMNWPELGVGLRPTPEDDTILEITWWRRPRLREAWPDKIYRDPNWLIQGWWDNGLKRTD